MTQTEQDSILLEKLKVNAQEAYLILYRLYYPDLARYILRNAGNRQDAEDMFQETLFILLQKIRSENFILQSELKTFLFSIQKNQWLKKLRDNKKSIIFDPLDIEATFDSSFEEEDVLPEKMQQSWIGRLFENITVHCVVLITRIFLKQDEPEQLIKELGYKNSHSFQNQKYKCINQLRKAGKKISTAG
jgi:RNA polymerase sigma factor (sigma-70 family)